LSEQEEQLMPNSHNPPFLAAIPGIDNRIGEDVGLDAQQPVQGMDPEFGGGPSAARWSGECLSS
jgi:hypothetical protein